MRRSQSTLLELDAEGDWFCAPFALVGLVAVSSGVALGGIVATNPQSTAMIPSSLNPFATAVRRF
jgi:hypothetical protein